MIHSLWRHDSAPRNGRLRRAKQSRQRANLVAEFLENRCLLNGTVTITSLTVPEGVEGQLSNPSVNAAFTDTNGVSANQLTATIDYGDGSALSTAAITKVGSTSYTVTDTHTFPEESGSVVPPNAFTVTLHVSENANAANTDTTTQQAFVLDAPLSPGDPVSPGIPQVFDGVAGTSTSAATALANFEAAIGGPNNGGAAPPQPLATGFRSINWDGVKLDGTDFGGPPNTTVIDSGKTVGIPLNRFQERGVFFGAVYAVSTDAQPGNSFADVNPNVAGLFPAFSEHNTFAMFNDNGIDFKFVVPSPHTTTVVSAASRGFGAIFVNVRLPNTSSIEYFNGSTSLGKYFVQPGAAGQSEFLGVLFNSPIITNVQLTLGTDAIFKFDGTNFTAGTALDQPGSGHNLVVTDDFAYAEPQPIASGFPIVSGSPGISTQAAVQAVVITAFTGTVATFSDADPNANAKDYTAVINWGDGHSTNGSIVADGNGGFSVKGTNSYAIPGNFPISVDIQDFGGGPAQGGNQPTLSVTNTAHVSAGNQNHRYVAQLYLDLLGRTVDPSGLLAWGGALDAGILTRLQVAQGITSSFEYRVVEVNAAYHQILNRAPDPGGLNYFVHFLQSGGTVEQLKANLLGSAEFAVLCQSMPSDPGVTTSNQKLVDCFYREILHRAPDPGGLAYFSGLLDSNFSPYSVALILESSTESLDDLVKSDYLALLHRTADTGGLTTYVNDLLSGLRDEDVIDRIVASDEYFARAA